MLLIARSGMLLSVVETDVFIVSCDGVTISEDDVIDRVGKLSARLVE